MFLVALLGIGIGFLLILLIARSSPPAPQHSILRMGGPQIAPDELEAIVRELAQALGLEVLLLSRAADGLIEATLCDHRPWVGGRLLLHARALLDRGQVGPADVLAFADLVHSEHDISRGVFIALGGFSEESRAAASSCAAAIDLVDGPRLLELARELLPEQAERLRA